MLEIKENISTKDIYTFLENYFFDGNYAILEEGKEVHPKGEPLPFALMVALVQSYFGKLVPECEVAQAIITLMNESNSVKGYFDPEDDAIKFYHFKYFDKAVTFHDPDHFLKYGAFESLGNKTFLELEKMAGVKLVQKVYPIKSKNYGNVLCTIEALEETFNVEDLTVKRSDLFSKKPKNSTIVETVLRSSRQRRTTLNSNYRTVNGYPIPMFSLISTSYSSQGLSNLLQMLRELQDFMFHGSNSTLEFDNNPFVILTRSKGTPLPVGFHSREINGVTVDCFRSALFPPDFFFAKGTTSDGRTRLIPCFSIPTMRQFVDIDTLEGVIQQGRDFFDTETRDAVFRINEEADTSVCPTLPIGLYYVTNIMTHSRFVQMQMSANSFMYHSGPGSMARIASYKLYGMIQLSDVYYGDRIQALISEIEGAPAPETQTSSGGGDALINEFGIWSSTDLSTTTSTNTTITQPIPPSFFEEEEPEEDEEWEDEDDDEF